MTHTCLQSQAGRPQSSRFLWKNLRRSYARHQEPGSARIVLEGWAESLKEEALLSSRLQEVVSEQQHEVQNPTPFSNTDLLACDRKQHVGIDMVSQASV